MTKILTGLAAIALIALAPLARAAELSEPPAGSAERKAILDAIRPAVEAQLRTRVEFRIGLMLTDGDWAYVVAEPQHPDGGAIDPKSTAFADMIETMDGLTTYGLARFANGRWNHISDLIGPTDAAFLGWKQTFGVPGNVLGEGAN